MAPRGVMSQQCLVWWRRLWLMALPAVAQIYRFVDEPVPEAMTLKTLYAFYAYSEGESPGPHKGDPFVLFDRVRIRAPLKVTSAFDYPQRDGEEDRGSVQLVLVRYSQFWDLIDPQQFCSSYADVSIGRAKAANQLLLKSSATEESGFYELAIPLANSSHEEAIKDVPRYDDDEFSYRPQDEWLAPSDVKRKVYKSGIYLLVLTNCGQTSEGVVEGKVVVKNSYGYLPGSEFPKVALYQRQCFAYILLGLVWAALSYRWRRDLLPIQNCIAGIIALGAVESILWYLFLSDWNERGSRQKILCGSALLATVAKSACAYGLVLVASQGWGVTKSFLEPFDRYAIPLLLALFMVLDFLREFVMQFKQTDSVSYTFVLLCLIPVSCVNGVLFYWIFTSLSNLLEILEERRQKAKLKVFTGLFRILVVVLVAVSLTLVMEVFALAQNVSAWRYQWVFTDGMQCYLFIFVLSAMMFLWAPHKNSKRFSDCEMAEPVNDEGTELTSAPPVPVFPDECPVPDATDEERRFADTLGTARCGEYTAPAV